MSVAPQASSLKRFARRLARPLASPIDGRVGDINRRIEHQGERLNTRVEDLSGKLDGERRSLETFAHTSSAASAYIGVELGRLHDLIAGMEGSVRELGERSFQQYYEERIEHAYDLPLAKLDLPLAKLMTHLLGPEGFAAQAGLWFNPPVSIAFGPGVAGIAQVNERIVEVPFAMRALARLKPGARILDVGSAESTFPLSAASLGFQVTAVDPRPLSYEHPNLVSHACSLEEWSGPSEPFAAAFLISTIEHVGLGAYGARRFGSSGHGVGADRVVLDRVRELLGPEAFMVLSTPYGVRAVSDFERVYDQDTLDTLLAGWDTLERQIVTRRNPLVWEPDETVKPDERGVAMVVASPQRSR